MSADNRYAIAEIKEKIKQARKLVKPSKERTEQIAKWEAEIREIKNADRKRHPERNYRVSKLTLDEFMNRIGDSSGSRTLQDGGGGDTTESDQEGDDQPQPETKAVIVLDEDDVPTDVEGA